VIPLPSERDPFGWWRYEPGALLSDLQRVGVAIKAVCRRPRIENLADVLADLVQEAIEARQDAATRAAVLTMEKRAKAQLLVPLKGFIYDRSYDRGTRGSFS
jgi:hypothetical protein